MIGTLNPYPAYKDSGVPWLGEVPAHWEVRRVRNIVEMRVSNVDKHSKDGEEPVRLCNYVDVYKNDRIRANMEFMKATASAEEIKRFRLEHGDVLITKDSEAWDDIGVPALVESSAPDLIIGYHLALLRPKQLAEGAFLLRVIQCRPVAYQFHVEAKGVTRYGLSHHAIKSTSVPLPPLPEQTAIVRFLDWAERRIRRVIRARQRRIKLLEEYRQAVIHQAVTGQIDVRTGKRYPAYKDSGVEWLGQVPEHWEVRRLKRIARLNPSKSEIPLAMRNDPAVFLPMERVGLDGQIDASEVRSISALWNGFTYFRRGDVIVAKITPCFENGKGACLQNLPTSVGFGSTEFHVIRPSGAVTVPYLYRITTLSEFRRLGADEMTGAAGQQRVPAEFIANFLIPLPPLPEQTAIAEYLDAQTAKIDAAIAAARREIELLREYRERLIADVVTGKVDVREVAQRLPEELEEPELLQEETEPLTGESEETIEALSADEESED